MLILLAIPVLVLVALMYRLLQAVAPSNLVVTRVRAAHPTVLLSAGVGALAMMLLAVGHEVSVAIRHGAPGWLNLVVLVMLWDAIKLNVLAVSVLMRSLRVVARRVGYRLLC